MICVVGDLLCLGNALRTRCYVCNRACCANCSTLVANNGLRVRMCTSCLSDPDSTKAQHAAAILQLQRFSD